MCEKYQYIVLEMKNDDIEKRNIFLNIGGKNIMAFGEISNSKGLGYNLLLVDSGEIYGDWLIVKNKNNFSYMKHDKERRELFAFDLEELPDEINKVQVTHLYTSDLEEYNDEKFISLINMLAIM